MNWARETAHVVITPDLDFSQILFTTQAHGPSVVLLRLDNEFDPTNRTQVCEALEMTESSLLKGALLTIAGKRVRLRHLPVTPRN